MSDLPTPWQFMSHARKLGQEARKRAAEDPEFARPYHELHPEGPMKPGAAGALYDAMTLPEVELIARFGKGARR